MNALSPSLFEVSYPLKIEGIPKVLINCHYDEDMGDEEGFRTHIQSQQSWQLVACGQGHCSARVEHRDSVFLASFLQFHGIATSICLYNIHRLSCEHAQDNQSRSPLDYPKTLMSSPSC